MLALTAKPEPTRADLADGVKAYDAGNYAVAFPEFRKAAAQGYAMAQYVIGMMYDNGNRIVAP